MALEYIKPDGVNNLTFTSFHGHEVNLSTDIIEESIHYAHETLDKFIGFGVNVFEILGMRNLSAFIGEIFAASLIRNCNGQFIKNPHQDGYPDLLLMDDVGKDIYASLKLRLRDKAPFSPFANGGIEVKATCGAVPSAATCIRRGLVDKPGIGDQRISVLTGYDWKAHHRDTNNLLGILWDFIGGVPRIVAVFTGNNLTVEDWGAIVQPKEGGGRTTSVSIMTRAGVKKMYDGTLFALKSQQYINFLNRYNRGALLSITEGDEVEI